jgi:hypothetical protein
MSTGATNCHWQGDSLGGHACRDRGHTLRRLNRETKDLVAKHWPQIRRVATTLMSTDTVTGSELDELINRKTR